MIGIIGGSGLADLAGLTDVRRRVVRTPWGDPSCALTFGRLEGAHVAFLARHGYGHTILPHEINYRANIQALHDCGVRQILAVAAVGGIRDDLTPGSLLVPDQLIDYTHGRTDHFDRQPGANALDAHIDFTEPYSAALRKRLITAAAVAGEQVHDGGTYGCTQGPRLETAAEVRRLARDGCDVVGMTGMPEALLARACGIDYATLCISVNDAAGLRTSSAGVDFAQINLVMTRVVRILACAARDGEGA